MAEHDGFELPVPLVLGASGGFPSVSVLCQRRSARLKRTGERLASASDQSDVYVCPKKERAGMKRNPSESGTKNLADELAELRGLNATALKQRWRVLYRPKRQFALVTLFCFKPLPTGYRKEFSAASNPPPAACSSGPQKTMSTGDRQPVCCCVARAIAHSRSWRARSPVRAGRGHASSG